MVDYEQQFTTKPTPTRQTKSTWFRGFVARLFELYLNLTRIYVNYLLCNVCAELLPFMLNIIPIDTLFVIIHEFVTLNFTVSTGFI